MSIVFIKQHNHTLMLNLRKLLRIILLRSENKKNITFATSKDKRGCRNPMMLTPKL